MIKLLPILLFFAVFVVFSANSQVEAVPNSKYITISHPTEAEPNKKEVPVTVKLTNPKNSDTEFSGYVEFRWAGINNISPVSVDTGSHYWMDGTSNNIKYFWRGTLKAGKTATFSTTVKTGTNEGKFQLAQAEFILNINDALQTSEPSFLIIKAKNQKTPTPTATRTQTPTPTPLPTLNPEVDGVRIFGTIQRELTINQGRSVKAFTVASTRSGWVYLQMYGYPTTSGQGIRWNPSASWILVPNTVDISVSVDQNVPVGTYSGEIVIQTSPNYKKVSLGKITVKVVANIPPTATRTPTATQTPATSTRPKITSVSPLTVKPGDWVTIQGENFLTYDTKVKTLQVWLFHDNGGANDLASVVDGNGYAKPFVSWSQTTIQFKVPEDKVPQSGFLNVIVNDKFDKYPTRFTITGKSTPTLTKSPVYTTPL